MEEVVKIENKSIIIGIIIIIFGSIILSGFISPFVDIEEQETNWVDDYGATTLTGFMFDLVKYPVASITWLFEFLSTPFVDSKENISIIISGTGTDDGNTLDGVYIYDTYSLGFLRFKHEDYSAPKREIRIMSDPNLEEETFDMLDARILYNKLFWDILIFNATGPQGDELITTWEKINDDYTFNPTATGTFQLSSEDINDYKGMTTQVFEFFDVAKEQAKEKVRYLGLIPEAIGIPLLFILYLMIVLGIIKLLPLT